MWCIFCDSDPCTCTPEQRFAREHPDMTDQERETIKKNALYERHQATDDLALHRQKIRDIQQRLSRVSTALDATPNDSGSPLLQFRTSIPSADDILKADAERRAAAVRLEEAQKLCASLGLDSNRDAGRSVDSRD